MANVPSPILKFLDLSSQPLAGGSVMTTVPGTLTPVTTYQDYLLTVPNSNPITLDGAGSCTMYSQSEYIRMIVYDANNVLTIDTVTTVPSTIADIEANPATFVSALSGTTSDKFANGADSRITGSLQSSKNLSDLASLSASRTNLGLAYGTSSSTVAVGNDSRFYSSPQQIKGISYVLTSADAGTTIYFNANTSPTLTIPSNSSVPFSVETLVGIRVANGVTVSVAITSDTLMLIPTGTTGTRVITGPGLAYISKAESTLWTISGAGVS